MSGRYRLLAISGEMTLAYNQQLTANTFLVISPPRATCEKNDALPE